MFTESSNLYLPISPTENDLPSKLKAIILYFKNNFSSYYERYFPVIEVPNHDMIISKCYLIDKWVREKPLIDFFVDSYYDKSENIEKDISFIQDKVAYGLPLMIKPLYDIRLPDSLFPRFIEMGAYNPITRKLIELNIPRETAIYLNKTFSFENIEDRKSIIEQVRHIRADLSYWHKIQLDLI